MKKHIALFIPNLAMGGAERVFVTLSRLLLERGHQVSLVLAEKSGPLLGELDSRVNVIDLAAFRSNEPQWKSAVRTVLALKRYLQHQPPDVLLSTLTGANLAAILAWLLAGKSCRLVIREAVSLANVRSMARKLLMRMLYPLADHIVLLTDFMKQEMLQLGLPAQKLSVLGNPVDRDRIHAMAEQEVLPDWVNFPYILSVGRLTEQKDFPTLIHAFAALKRNPELKMLILGEGPERATLEELIDSLQLNGRVKLMGLLPNPYPWFKHACIFALSSRWEGYPNVLLEALCFELPVVVTEYDSSVRTILSRFPSDFCHIVPVGDIQRMAYSLNKILTQSDLYNPEYTLASTDMFITGYEALLTAYA